MRVPKINDLENGITLYNPVHAESQAFKIALQPTMATRSMGMSRLAVARSRGDPRCDAQGTSVCSLHPPYDPNTTTKILTTKILLTTYNYGATGLNMHAHCRGLVFMWNKVDITVQPEKLRSQDVPLIPFTIPFHHLRQANPPQ
ncbi:hypothetical protein PENFLA_c040G05960 [Penicillium flavigenum]|uniref:Uncharacterized protein n=1 Tax=Penicillium flavigenum TaxID=254877 RepID=A0A1V6SKC5_9EURO|nr:hypothetical protein PENFLA_c040G05960 [Penicillium flavigenum]